MYCRVYIDNYFEDEFASEEEAIENFLFFLRNGVSEDNIIVEVFNEEKEEWE